MDLITDGKWVGKIAYCRTCKESFILTENDRTQIWESPCNDGEPHVGCIGQHYIIDCQSCGEKIVNIDNAVVEGRNEVNAEKQTAHGIEDNRKLEEWRKSNFRKSATPLIIINFICVLVFVLVVWLLFWR